MRVRTPPRPSIYVLLLSPLAAESKVFLNHTDDLNPERLMAESIKAFSSGDKRTDTPGDLAFSLGTFGLPALLVIK